MSAKIIQFAKEKDKRREITAERFVVYVAHTEAEAGDVLLWVRGEGDDEELKLGVAMSVPNNSRQIAYDNKRMGDGWRWYGRVIAVKDELWPDDEE